MAARDEITNRDAVARRAYELFLSRGGEHGHDQEDWYRAEQEVSGAANSDVGSPAEPEPAMAAPRRAVSAKTPRPRVAGKK